MIETEIRSRLLNYAEQQNIGATQLAGRVGFADEEHRRTMLRFLGGASIALEILERYAAFAANLPPES
jgi:hypothetical protein